MSRLATGGRIQRDRPLSFCFDGRALTGFEGDTLASALIANDVKLVGRSFKYHRPRGILTAGNEEPNALVTLGCGAYAEPNTRATTVPLFDGLEAKSQNRWPSLRFDFLAINQLFSPVLVAGFYYKTFMWPAAFWEKFYEPLIRRAAGLGSLSGLPDPSPYDVTHAFCDLLVIGAGPAGLASALLAARAGLRVIIAYDDVEAGGQLLSEDHLINDMPSDQWCQTSVEELQSLSNVTILARTGVFGMFDGQEYGAVERVGDNQSSIVADLPRQRLWKIVAKHAVLATGAIERPLVFGGNDRPGVMMASAVTTYVRRYAAIPGKRAVVFTSTDSGWSTARTLHDAGVEVAAIVDPRKIAPRDVNLENAGVSCFMGAVIEDVIGRSVKGAIIRTCDGSRRRVEADFLAMSGGWNPAIGIASNLGDKPQWSEELSSFVMASHPKGLSTIGAAAGQFRLADVLADGVRAAEKVIEACGAARIAIPEWRASNEAADIHALWHVEGSRTKAFVDFQHDVTDTDIALAEREGFRSIEHLKRYTTLGMATDQGKTSQLNGHALLAAAAGRSIAEAGTIMSRPPYFPVAIGALAGHHRGLHFRPERRAASHDWAIGNGAVFVDAGLWKRPQWYALPGESDWRTSVNREASAVRNAVGICDVSTLGKIEVMGPDAGTFLDRLYINTFSSLPIGKARYGVMLREDGIVLDDGTATRLAEDRYYLTTTTAQAARVMQHIDFARQVLWPNFDVQATSVTEQWCTYAVAGPRSRDLLSAQFPSLDVSNEAIPYMGFLEFRWRGNSARLFRVSFSGELAYEVAVPSTCGDELIRSLIDIGRQYGVTPYGTEALSVLRIEKGHVAGPELNGQTTAADLGLGRMMSVKKDFIGRALAQRPGLIEKWRPALVGVRPVEEGDVLSSGGHLLPIGAAAVAANDQGWTSSSCYSPALRHWIALAFVKGGRERIGERLRLRDAFRGIDAEVEICDPVFFDPEGTRVRG